MTESKQLVDEDTATQPRSSRGDWWRLVGVGVVAIVLSLVGFNVASQLEPSGSPAPPPAAIETTDGPTTTSAAPTTTALERDVAQSDPEDQTAGATAGAEPAALTLSDDLVELDIDNQTAILEIAHEGGPDTSWSLTAELAGVTLSPSAGELGPQETVSVTATFDPSQMEEEGQLESGLTLTWDGGRDEARVVTTHEDNPVIHNPRAAPGSVQVGDGCGPTQTTISARVSDTTEIADVFARWSPDGSGMVETEMNPIGGDIYEAVIGPYEVADRTDSVRVLAYDSRDNAGGAAVPVTVTACE